MRVVVAMTGATGMLYGVRLLERLREAGVETDLILSRAAVLTLHAETDVKLGTLQALASRTHSVRDIAAPIASGSCRFDAMVVVPCSAKTLAMIAHGYADNLIGRAADVTLKERRKLILVFREAPLSRVHLQNLLAVHDAGATIVPPVPSFYHRPSAIEELVDDTVGRLLDLLGLEHGGRRWQGLP
ncbi:MAG TPA: UbiX family flavin prenyltransferase [Acidobacteriota bacterium]